MDLSKSTALDIVKRNRVAQLLRWKGGQVCALILNVAGRAYRNPRVSGNRQAFQPAQLQLSAQGAVTRRRIGVFDPWDRGGQLSDVRSGAPRVIDNKLKLARFLVEWKIVEHLNLKRYIAHPLLL